MALINEIPRRSTYCNLDNSNAMNDRSTTLRLNESKNSKYNYDSLPFNHLKETGIKRLINSDTFSQTKTLFYTDHQKSPSHYVRRSFENKDVHQSPPNSFESLNSSDDPDIVAAIDQIASTMGLIDCKVSRMSNDPVNYLLKTRSFSEKISIHKSSPNNNRMSSRVQSYMDHTESNIMKLDNNLIPNSPIASISKKKETCFRKMIQQLSPKLLRRTKSTSPTPNKFPKSIFNRNSTKQNNADILLTADINASNNYSTISNETCHEEIVDKFENTIEYTNNNNENENKEMSHTTEISSPVMRYLTPASARYISISLSAFGYGPISSLPNLTPVRRSLCQSSKYNDISGDQNYSDQDKINHK